MKHSMAARGGGFTLIELMIVLGVLALLLGMAVPAMSAVVDAMRLRSYSQSLIYSLNLGRSEAIKRAGRVVVCRSGNGLDCAPTGGWEQGWIVFHDPNNNARVDAGEQVLQREQALGGDVRVDGNRWLESYVSYTALGHTSLTNGGFQAGTLTLCSRVLQPGTAHQIVIASSGRVRSQKVTLQQCGATG